MNFFKSKAENQRKFFWIAIIAAFAFGITTQIAIIKLLGGFVGFGKADVVLSNAQIVKKYPVHNKTDKTCDQLIAGRELDGQLFGFSANRNHDSAFAGVDCNNCQLCDSEKKFVKTEENPFNFLTVNYRIRPPCA